VPPALDAEFIKQFGEFESVEAFRAKVKDDLTAERNREILQGYQNQLADQMRERYDFAVPEALVHQALHELEHRLEHDEPDVLKDEATLAARKEEERGKIVTNLRLAYAVDALARQYGIEADAEAVRQRFNMQAYMLRQNPTDLIQTPFGERMLMQIRENMVTGQTLEKLAQDVLAAGGGKKAGAAKAKAKPAKDEEAATATPAPKAGSGKAAAKDKAKAGASKAKPKD
jgi:trigger factor